MKKPRGDAILKNLPDAVQKAIWEATVKITLPLGVEWVRTNHGVKVSVSMLQKFLAWYPFSRPLERVAVYAQQFQQALTANPNLRLNAEQSSEAAHIAFEQFTIATQDIESHVALRKLRLKEQEQQLAERRVALLEAAAEQAKQAKGIAGDEDLTPEEKESRIKAVFGIHA